MCAASGEKKNSVSQGNISRGYQGGENPVVFGYVEFHFFSGQQSFLDKGFCTLLKSGLQKMLSCGEQIGIHNGVALLYNVTGI